MTAQDQARIAARYPDRTAARRRGMVLAVVLGTVLVAWMIWAGWHGSRPDVEADVHGYRVISDSEIELTIRVDRADPQRPAQCTLMAQSVDFERVGELQVTVEPAETTTSQHTFTLKTIKPAVTGTVEHCELA